MSDPEPTTAETNLAKIDALIAANPGVTRVVVDGVDTTFADLIAQRKYWQREVNMEQGKRSTIVHVDLSNF